MHTDFWPAVQRSSTNAYWLLASSPAVKYTNLNGRPCKKMWDFFFKKNYKFVVHDISCSRLWMSKKQFTLHKREIRTQVWSCKPCKLTYIANTSFGIHLHGNFLSFGNKMVDTVSSGACAIGLFLLHRWPDFKTQWSVLKTQNLSRTTTVGNVLNLGQLGEEM